MDGAGTEHAHDDWGRTAGSALGVRNQQDVFSLGQNLITATQLLFAGFLVEIQALAKVAVADELLADLRGRVDQDLLACRGLAQFGRHLGQRVVQRHGQEVGEGIQVEHVVDVFTVGRRGLRVDDSTVIFLAAGLDHCVEHSAFRLHGAVCGRGQAFGVDAR
ncbi:hypothetical protein D3C73_920790 [compost metagenome]